MIKKYLTSVLKFEHLWVFMPTLLLLLYVPQMVAGIFKFGDRPAYTLAGVVVLGFVVYLVAYWVKVPVKFTIRGQGAWHTKLLVPSKYAIWAISIFYFSLIAYALFSSQKVALWEALSGASADDIAFAREALFKNRLGWEKSLIYFNAIGSSALMPFAVALCYIEKKSYRHVFLVMFALSLLPSMEKVLILKALLPLIILGINGYFPRKRVIQTASVAAVVIAGAFFFTKMGKTDYLKENQITLDLIRAEKVSLFDQMTIDSHAIAGAQEPPSALEKQKLNIEVEAIQKKYAEQATLIQKKLEYYLWVEKSLSKYNYSGTGYGQGQYFLNRIFWIPYVTAYDWIGYFYEKLDGQYLLGKTSSLIARVKGEVQYPMEREVFKYQFGESGPQTAAANASFLVDAFVNFGWLGVAVYSALFATLTRVVMVQANPAMQACYFYFAFQASMGGLTGVLFSNGMLLLICLAFFVKPTMTTSTHPRYAS